MKSEPEVDDELIAKYLSGDASAEEAMALVQWLQLPANRVQFEQLEKTWNASARNTKPTFDTGRAWSRIANAITSDGKKNRTDARWWQNKTVRLAASLFLVTTLAAILVLNLTGGKKNSVTATTQEIKSVTLSDSSIVTLFRFSSIEYPFKFEGNTRTVDFAKGEAFFKVTRNKQKPFIIHTPIANIKVVGTEFNVKVEDNRTEVAVKEGMVLVSFANDSLFLTAGSGAVFLPEGKPKVSYNPVDNNVWSYATRKLVFKDTPMETVIGDLQRTYSCTISFENKEIGSCKLTATFENDSVDKIIHLIAETLSLEVTGNGNVFVLAGEGCP